MSTYTRTSHKRVPIDTLGTRHLVNAIKKRMRLIITRAAKKAIGDIMLCDTNNTHMLSVDASKDKVYSNFLAELKRRDLDNTLVLQIKQYALTLDHEFAIILTRLNQQIMIAQRKQMLLSLRKQMALLQAEIKDCETSKKTNRT